MTNNAKPLTDVKPGQHNPWHFIGGLSAQLEAKGRITKADWNRIAEMAAAFQTKSDADLAAMRSELAAERAETKRLSDEREAELRRPPANGIAGLAWTD